MRIYFSYAFLLIGFVSMSQVSITGNVKDSNHNPIAGATISYVDQVTYSDNKGNFSLTVFYNENQQLKVSYIGYKTYKIDILPKPEISLKVILEDDYQNIEAVLVSGTSKEIQNKKRISSDYIYKNYAGSLSQSLENVAGLNVMSIGSGSSKPILRGLGMNRIAVTVNGNKHESQQWGADHGLEIDALSQERVDYIKGVAAIEYGSDAIAGVLSVRNNSIPEQNSFNTNTTLLARSVNNSVGVAFDLQHRDDKFFQKFKASIVDYADFKTTTDSIVYLTRNIPIHNRSVKNTAGNQWNVFGQIGYVKENYHSIFTISNNYSKAGFFPGAHGIPDLNRLHDDQNSRNIEYPYQRVNHLTLQNEHKWFFSESELALDVSYQNNHRQEISEFHTHYGNQNTLNQSDVELDFNLNTYGLNAKYTQYLSDNHKSDVGFQTQHQQNNISGYSFLLPEFTRSVYGAYILHEYNYSDNLRFDFGLRYDFGHINIREFYDQTLYNYLIFNNYQENIATEYALRSPALSRDFSNYNFKFGTLYSVNSNLDFTLNLGSSFRNPTAIELGANGIHHGSFRHEKGNENLEAERSYIIDFQTNFAKDKFAINFSPYLYYFSNYIFLNPTGEFSVLPHAGQLYKYSQTKALLTGFELENTYSFNRFSTQFVLEYIYNKQISSGLPLPFTPPLNAFLKLDYTLFEDKKYIEKSDLFVSYKYFAPQKRVAQNEQITPESSVFGIGFNTTFRFGALSPKLLVSAQNLLNTKYYSHTSFYRALEIPEQGRNIQVMIQIPL